MDFKVREELCLQETKNNYILSSHNKKVLSNAAGKSVDKGHVVLILQ